MTQKAVWYFAEDTSRASKILRMMNKLNPLERTDFEIPLTIQPHRITGLGEGGAVTRSPIVPSSRPRRAVTGRARLNDSEW